MCCSLPGSSVHGIFQARILEWLAISSFRGSSQPRDQTQVSWVSCFGRWILYHWTTGEVLFFGSGPHKIDWILKFYDYAKTFLSTEWVGWYISLRSFKTSVNSHVPNLSSYRENNMLPITKKAEHQRNNAFELWFWRRLLRVLWSARRSNQSILKEINHETHWKDWYWSWRSNTLATWWEELTY